MPVISIDVPKPVWEKLNAQAEATQREVQEVILSRLLPQGENGGLYQRFCDENPDLFVTKEEEATPRCRALSEQERQTLAEKAGRGGSLSTALIAERREQI